MASSMQSSTLRGNAKHTADWNVTAPSWAFNGHNFMTQTVTLKYLVLQIFYLSDMWRKQEDIKCQIPFQRHHKYWELLVERACWNGLGRMFYVTAFVFLFCFLENPRPTWHWILVYLFIFLVFKNSSYLFSMKRIGNWKSLQHFFVIGKFVSGGVQEEGTIQISCVLQYEKGSFFSGVSCGSITGEKLQRRERIG